MEFMREMKAAFLWLKVVRINMDCYYFVWFWAAWFWDLWLFLFSEEANSESGNPIWKNRVESWKEKKNKKSAAKKAKKEEQIPVEQQMEGKE